MKEGRKKDIHSKKIIWTFNKVKYRLISHKFKFNMFKRASVQHL